MKQATSASQSEIANICINMDLRNVWCTSFMVLAIMHAIMRRIPGNLKHRGTVAYITNCVMRAQLQYNPPSKHGKPKALLGGFISM